MKEVTLGFSKAAYYCPVDSSYKVEQEIIDWLSSAGFAPEVFWSIDDITRGILVTFVFREPGAAMLFKLTWGGE